MLNRRSFLQGALAVFVGSAVAPLIPITNKEELESKIVDCKYPEVIKIMKDRFNQLVFEPNDQYTRDKWKQMVETDLQEFIYNRKLMQFKVICDETNNPPDDKFTGEVLIQPTNRVEYLVYKIQENVS